MSEDRAQRLRTLLAKVQANAAIPVPGRPSPASATAWPADSEYTSFPDTERPPASSIEEQQEFTAAALRRFEPEEDKWSSLLSKALDREILPPPHDSRRAARSDTSISSAPHELDAGEAEAPVGDARVAVGRRRAAMRAAKESEAPPPAPALAEEEAAASPPDTRFIESGAPSDASLMRLAPELVSDARETQFAESGQASDASAMRLAPPILEDAAQRAPSPLMPEEARDEPAPPAPPAARASQPGAPSAWPLEAGDEAPVSRRLERQPSRPSWPHPQRVAVVEREPESPPIAAISPEDDEATIPLVGPKLVLIEPRAPESAPIEPPAPSPRARADSNPDAPRSGKSARDSSSRESGSGRGYSIKEEMREREDLDFDDAPEAPPSALERAIAKAARQRAIDVGAEDAIWGDVIDNLRERRSTRPPEELLRKTGAPGSQPGTRRSSRPEDDESYAPLPRTFIPRIDVPPPPEPSDSSRSLSPTSRRIRKRFRAIMPRRGPVTRESRPRWVGWVLGAAGVAAVTIIAFILVPRWLAGTPSPSATSIATETRPSDTTTRSSGPSVSTTSPTQAQPQPQPAPSTISSTPPAASGSPAAPPDIGDLAYHQGYVYFVSERPLHVYVNGNFAGETNQWLKMECEYRNVRFADRSVPRVGSGFPLWDGEGHTIVVPCKKATTLDAQAR